MMSKHLGVAKRALLAGACIMLAGCATTARQDQAHSSERKLPPIARPKQTGTPFAHTLSQGLLTAKLYPKLAESAGPNANLFISPVSLSQGLGLALLGARGQTADEIRALLGQEGNPSNGTLAYNHFLSDTGDEAVTLGIANALWLADTLPVRPEFLAEARSSYGAAPEPLDFRNAPAKAADRINGWVDQETRGRIGKIVSANDLGTNTAAILTNALYFKGKWRSPFVDSRPSQFTRGDGSKIAVDLMEQIGRFDYREDRNGQAIALPYGQDGRFVMEVFLPRDAAALSRMEQRFNGPSFFAGEQGGDDLFVLSAVPEQEVQIALPRFEARFDRSVKAALMQAGMTTAFDRSRADLSGIAEDVPLVISDVAHATFLRVDEQGTEAAAVTSVTIVTTGARRLPKNLPKMIVDRPFLATLRDRASGAILFFGRIADPTPVSRAPISEPSEGG